MAFASEGVAIPGGLNPDSATLGGKGATPSVAHSRWAPTLLAVGTPAIAQKQESANVRPVLVKGETT